MFVEFTSYWLNWKLLFKCYDSS